MIMGSLADSSDLKAVHEIVLRMLKIIDEICEKENISYFMQGGTLLGAIREKGFIPWDDDADVMMHREDFDKFEQCCKEPLEAAGFYFNYTDRVPKVCMREKPEVRVDIFIIDLLYFPAY